MADVHPVSSPQTLRRAALFPGNNTFLCGGRLMMGADPSVFLLAELMIWGPAAAFFAIVSPHQHAAVGAAVALLLAVVIYLHVRTAFTEPGIIPRSDSLQRPPTPPDATAQGVRYCDVSLPLSLSLPLSSLPPRPLLSHSFPRPCCRLAAFGARRAPSTANSATTACCALTTTVPGRATALASATTASFFGSWC